MREAQESVYRIVHGSTVLLDLDDWLLEDPEIQPVKDVQRSQFAGGLAARTWDRGNKMHTLTFSRWRLHSSTWQAAAARLATLAAWPDGAQDVTVGIAFHTGTLTIYKATITGLKCQAYDRLTLTEYVVEGGALTGELTFSGLPGTDPVPVDDAIGGEDGSAIGDEGGGMIEA